LAVEKIVDRNPEKTGKKLVGRRTRVGEQSVEKNASEDLEALGSRIAARFRGVGTKLGEPPRQTAKPAKFDR